jgi:hypothetical protein
VARSFCWPPPPGRGEAQGPLRARIWEGATVRSIEVESSLRRHAYLRARSEDQPRIRKNCQLGSGMGCEFRTGIRFSIPAAWFIRSGSGIKPPSLRNALGSHGSRNLAAPAADGGRPVPVRGAGLAFGGNRAPILLARIAGSARNGETAVAVMRLACCILRTVRLRSPARVPFHRHAVRPCVRRARARLERSWSAVARHSARCRGA